MSADASPIPAAARRPALTLSRLARLALKELKETLRDRRTVITLVLMPALLYPLLSLAFRQFVLSNVPRESESRVRIGLATDAEQELLLQLLEAGDAVLDSHAAPAASDARSAIELAPPSELAQSALQSYTSRDPGLPL